MWCVATSEPGAKTFTLGKYLPPKERALLACSQCQKAECEQIICLKHIGIIWALCLIFEVQENTESHLSSSWKIFCKSVWNCLLAGAFTFTLMVSDFPFLSLIRFLYLGPLISSYFILGLLGFIPAGKTGKPFLGSRLPLPIHPSKGLNRSHSDHAWQCPNVSKKILPRGIQAYTKDKIVCPDTFVLWPRILKYLSKTKKWNLPP